MIVIDENSAEGGPAVSAPALPAVTARPRRVRKLATGRRVRDRITASMVVGVVLALLAFVLVAAVLRDRREMTTGLVPRERIPVGAAITADLVEAVEFPASVPFADALLTADALGEGLTAGRTLEAGEPVTRSAVGQGELRTTGRVMSIPIASWGDVGGELVVGDQIDVIDTRDLPAYVVQGAVVVDRASGDDSGGALAAGTRLWVSVEVTGDEALTLAGVIEAGDFVIVRSTGADPIQTAPPTTVTPSSVPASESTVVPGVGG